MTDRRPLLRAIFDAAVAAAHPGWCWRGICARHRKGASSASPPARAPQRMAAAAERHYLDALELDPVRLTGIATTRHGHGVPTRRIRVVEAGHPVPDEAGLKGAEDSLRARRGGRARRSPAGAVVGRRLRQLDRAGRWRLVRAKTAGQPRAAALGRADRRGEYRPKASVADQGRPAGPRRSARRDRDAGDLGRAARRRFRDRIGTDRAGSDHAGRCARAGREIRPHSSTTPSRARAQRPRQRKLQAGRPRLCPRAIRTDRAAKGLARRRDQTGKGRRLRHHRSRRRPRRRGPRSRGRPRADGTAGTRGEASAWRSSPAANSP